MSEQLLQQIDELFTRRLGVFAEDVQHRFDLVVEGQQMLVERVDRLEVEIKSEIAAVDNRLSVVHAELSQKIDSVEQNLTKRMDGLEQRLDAVAVDLTAHRKDTEAHSIYRVGE